MRFILFQAIWIFVTFLLGVASPFILPFRGASRYASRSWNRFSLWLAKCVMGMEIEVQGREHIADGAAIYASKHQSSLDTFVMWVVLDDPVFVLKRELFKIPVFGWFLARGEPIAIDRSAGARAVDQISSQAKTKLGQGRKLVIFPQGTRQPVDAKPNYKSGGIAAVYGLGYPVIPVSLNTGTLWPKHGAKRSGKAIVRFSAPIEQGLAKDEMMQQVIAGCESVS